MPANLTKLSVINDETSTDIIVKLSSNSSGCLCPNDNFEFDNLDIDPTTGFSFTISTCGSDTADTLTLTQQDSGDWVQTVNGEAGPAIANGGMSPFRGTGPLFHLIGNTDGVVIVGTVDIDGPPTD